MIVRNIEFSNGITKICNSAFQGANINRITFPPSLVVIDDDVFDGASVIELCFKNYEDSQLSVPSLLYLVPTFSTLILKQNSEEIIIEKEELKISYTKKWYSDPSDSKRELTYLGYDIILDKLKEVIQAKIEKEKINKLELK